MGERKWEVIDYVAEEVSRQGHNLLMLDGIERVGWMLDGWAYALGQTHRPFDLPDIRNLGMIERRKNRDGFRCCGVRVGSHVCPPPQEVMQRLERLMQFNTKGMTPLEFYKEFELIHPFVDGNGRTGKILLNWKNGTLLNPIFPPADIFGEPIRNP